MTDDADDISSAASGDPLAARMAMNAPRRAASEAYKKQFTIAGGLDLTTSERAELAKVSAHG